MFDISSSNMTNVATMGIIIGAPLCIVIGFHNLGAIYLKNKIVLWIADGLVLLVVLGFIFMNKEGSFRWFMFLIRAFTGTLMSCPLMLSE